MTDTTKPKVAAAELASSEKLAPRSTKRRMAREPKAEGNERGAPAAAKSTKATEAKEPRGPSKIGLVIALLQRSEGATLAEMVKATGWLPHTTRAALTGLKKKGHVIAKGKRDDVTCYHIAKAA